MEYFVPNVPVIPMDLSVLQEPWAIILSYRRIGQSGACSVNRIGDERSIRWPFHHSTTHTIQESKIVKSTLSENSVASEK